MKFVARSHLGIPPFPLPLCGVCACVLSDRCVCGKETVRQGKTVTDGGAQKEEETDFTGYKFFISLARFMNVSDDRQAHQYCDEALSPRTKRLKNNSFKL